jgi:hypothetical protein
MLRTEICAEQLLSDYSRTAQNIIVVLLYRLTETTSLRAQGTVARYAHDCESRKVLEIRNLSVEQVRELYVTRHAIMERRAGVWLLLLAGEHLLDAAVTALRKMVITASCGAYIHPMNTSQGG